MKKQGLSPRCSAHFLYGMVYCEECGQPYRRYTAKNHTESYKTWRCKGRVAGMCHSRHIRESELITGICTVMGWDAIDEWALGEMIDKVLVTDYGLRLVEKTADDEKDQMDERTQESA